MTDTGILAANTYAEAMGYQAKEMNERLDWAHMGFVIYGCITAFNVIFYFDKYERVHVNSIFASTDKM